MTDIWLMEADCIHGNTWYDCIDCFILEETLRRDEEETENRDGV